MFDKNTTEGKWKQLKGEIQKTWGNITGDELEQTKGDMKSIAGIVQEKYGIAKEEASRRLSEMAERYSDSAKETMAKTTERAKEKLQDTKTPERH